MSDKNLSQRDPRQEADPSAQKSRNRDALAQKQAISEPMTSTERGRKYAEANPHSSSVRKEKQYQTERLYRFHYHRLRVSEIPLPDFINTECGAYRRVVKEWELIAGQPVEEVTNAQ